MTIQLFDQLVKIPRDILKDVLLEVQDFIFPMDFIVSIWRELMHIIKLLGRSFFATSHTCIDYYMEVMDISFGNKEVDANLFNIVIRLVAKNI